MPSLPPVEITRSGRTAKFHGSWYRGSSTNFIPSKPELSAPDGVERFVLPGWTPSAPVIDKSSAVLAFGSCFAAHVSDYLHERGNHVLGRHLDLDAHIIRFGEGMVNSFAIRQQLEWAFTGKEMPEGLWFSEHKDVCPVDPRFRSRPGRSSSRPMRSSSRWAFRRSGTTSGTARCCGARCRRISSTTRSTGFVCQRRLRTTTTWPHQRADSRRQADCAHHLHAVASSPDGDVSPGVVRDGEQRVQGDPAREHRRVDAHVQRRRSSLYFPSYEIVKDCVVNLYLDDNRHPKPEVVSFVMETFELHYCRP